MHLETAFYLEAPVCHLVHQDHTRRFFDFQEKRMPDREEWKKRLERVLV
ncbi:MAG: YgjP-like metallopeptidase domain-containing protein [Bacteroidota bacterium]